MGSSRQRRIGSAGPRVSPTGRSREDPEPRSRNGAGEPPSTVVKRQTRVRSSTSPPLPRNASRRGKPARVSRYSMPGRRPPSERSGSVAGSGEKRICFRSTIHLPFAGAPVASTRETLSPETLVGSTSALNPSTRPSFSRTSVPILGRICTSRRSSPPGLRCPAGGPDPQDEEESAGQDHPDGPGPVARRKEKPHRDRRGSRVAGPRDIDRNGPRGSAGGPQAHRPD